MCENKIDSPIQVDRDQPSWLVKIQFENRRYRWTRKGFAVSCCPARVFHALAALAAHPSRSI